MSIQTDIDRGLEIRREIKSLSLELEAIEGRLIEAGRKGEQIPLAEADREGRRFLAKGTEKIVPVIFTADKIIGSFADGGQTHGTIILAAPKWYPAFFRRKMVWERILDDGQRFRNEVAEKLGKDAPAFITACLARDKDGIPKSDEKVHWDRAEEVQP